MILQQISVHNSNTKSFGTIFYSDLQKNLLKLQTNGCIKILSTLKYTMRLDLMASFSPHGRFFFFYCTQRKGDLNTAELYLDLDIYKMEEALITRATCFICAWMICTTLTPRLYWTFLIIYIYVYPPLRIFATIPYTVRYAILWCMKFS